MSKYTYYTGNFFTKEFTQKQKGAPSVDYCETFEGWKAKPFVKGSRKSSEDALYILNWTDLINFPAKMCTKKTRQRYNTHPVYDDLPLSRLAR